MALHYVQASRELAQHAQSADLQHELLTAREEYEALYQQNQRLAERVAELERELRDAAGQLQYREPWYYRTMPDGSEQGPFCGRCYDTRGLCVRAPMRRVGGGGELRECPECRFHHWQREPRVDDAAPPGRPA